RVIRQGSRMMEFNRNQYFLAGLVIFLLGIQLRLVHGFVLNERATQLLHQRMQQIRGTAVASAGESTTLMASLPPGHTHRISPPKWLRWSLLRDRHVTYLSEPVVN